MIQISMRLNLPHFETISKVFTAKYVKYFIVC